MYMQQYVGFRLVLSANSVRLPQPINEVVSLTPKWQSVFLLNGSTSKCCINRRWETTITLFNESSLIPNFSKFAATNIIHLSGDLNDAVMDDLQKPKPQIMDIPKPQLLQQFRLDVTHLQ